MNDNNKVSLEEDYRKLVKKVHEELPGIVLPAMGMLDEAVRVDVDGKDYIIKDVTKED